MEKIIKLDTVEKLLEHFGKPQDPEEVRLRILEAIENQDRPGLIRVDEELSNEDL